MDAELHDSIGDFIIKDDFFDLFSPQQLQNLFVILLNHSKTYGERVSAIDALNRVLLGHTEQDYPQLYQHASSWLCHILASAVLTQLRLERQKQYENSPRRCDYTSSTSDNFADLLINYHKQKNKEMDSLLELFEEILANFPDQPWPEWSRAPRKFDMDIHVKYLKGLSEIEQLDAQPTGARKVIRLSAREAMMYHFHEYLENPDFPSFQPYTSETKNKPQSTPFEPCDPDVHAHLTNLARSALAWRKVFVTGRGHIGHGPRWLVGGEVVVLVCGADVPYVLTPLKVDQQARARQLRLEIDENDQKYYATTMKLQKAERPSFWKPLNALWYERQQEKLKRLDERRLELQDAYDRILNSVQNYDGFVLQGEVYIDGIMYGAGVGLVSRGRITIV